jgi:diguanylate cyclase (GGDEF)-like protein/PAS domain S-box-containing protein
MGLLEQVREHESASELPIVLISSRQDQAQIVHALDIGANDFLSKPLDFAIFRARLNSLLQMKASGAELRESKSSLEYLISEQARELQKANDLAMHEFSERKKAESELRKSEDQFKNAFEDAAIGMALCKYDGTIVKANAAVAEILGYSMTELVGKTIRELTHVDDHELTEQARKQILSGEVQKCSLEKRFVHKKGHSIWTQMNASSVNYDDQRELYAIIQLQDISKSHRMSEELTYHASHDGLTGLVNRDEFDRRLARVLMDLKVEQAEHALCYIDLDQFKVINDTCGHVAGDELLRKLGAFLRAKLRKRDTLARLGGDEFGVLLEHCPFEQAERIADELRVGIEEFRFSWDEKHLNVGASMGLVPIQNLDSIGELLSRADTACHMAKEQGRNRVQISRQDDEEVTQRRGEMEWVAKINEALE